MYAFLIVYNFIFFWKFWKNPSLNHTSEIGTTFYPHWMWMGKMLRSLKFPFKDKIYYKYPACIPFLSTFYLPHLLSSLTKSFKVLQYVILSHFIFGSFLAYILFLRWTSHEAA